MAYAERLSAPYLRSWRVFASADEPLPENQIGIVYIDGTLFARALAPWTPAGARRAVERVRDDLVFTGEFDAAEQMRRRGAWPNRVALERLEKLTEDGSIEAHLVAADVAEEHGLRWAATLHRNRARQLRVFEWLMRQPDLPPYVLEDVFPRDPSQTVMLRKDVATWHVRGRFTHAARIDRRGVVSWVKVARFG